MDDLMSLLGGGQNKINPNDNPLDHLFATLLGGIGRQEGGSPAELLSTLLAGEPVAGLAEQAQVTPTVVQAALALLAGHLAGEGASKEAGVDLNALLAQASRREEPDASALKASGLPQELMKTTGLDLSAAIKALQKLLPLLGGLLNLPGLKPSAAAKPKPKPAAASKPKPASATSKPKPSSAASKPKPKPKPASTTSKPKPTSTASKPKPASGSTAKPKPATKPRPRKSEGLPEIEINPDEPASPDA